jgi:lauroyl/myristoyl acyltransferase
MSIVAGETPEELPAVSSEQPSHGSPVLRGAGRALAYAFRVLPERLRFRAATLVARWLEPAIAITPAFAARAKLRTDDLREISLDMLLMMLTRHGTTFRPALRIDGPEHLPPPGAGPVLVVSPHTMLSVLFLRHLEDAGYEPFVIAAYPGMRIPGTRNRARVLGPSPALLLKVRGILAEGGMVTAMIDRDRPERRNSSVETMGGPVFVSDALLQLAVRCAARIVFLATKMDDASCVVVRLSAPSGDTDHVAAIVAQFADFVDGAQLIGAIRRPPA